MLFARNEEINQWLGENPLVLGIGAVVIALPLLALGVFALVSGIAPAKRGKDLTGSNAKVMAFVWLGFGGLVLLFGLFKIITGLLAPPVAP